MEKTSSDDTSTQAASRKEAPISTLSETLHFEEETLFNESGFTKLTEDGHVIKKILREGTGFEPIPLRATVTSTKYLHSR